MSKPVIVPREGSVYVSTSADEFRRVIGVHSHMKTWRDQPEKKPKKVTWITYSCGGDNNRRCQLTAFRRWLYKSDAKLVSQIPREELVTNAEARDA